MQDWLWIVIIVGGAFIATLCVYILAHRKDIFKKREKKGSAKKAARKTKKAQNKQPKVEAPAPKEDIVFVEKEVPKQKQFNVDNEQYSPSADFKSKNEAYTPLASAQVARRRPRMPQPPPPPIADDDFETFRKQHGYSHLYKQSIKDQIQNLSPEMKAILFGNVLDKKDDDLF